MVIGILWHAYWSSSAERIVLISSFFFWYNSEVCRDAIGIQLS